MIYSTVFTLVSLVVFMGNNALGLGAGAWLKMMTSTGFLAMSLSAGGLHSLYGRIILAALFFSWWGDLFLISSKEKIFLMGLAAFFIGHVAFAGAFFISGVDWKYVAISTLVGLIPLLIFLRWLNPHLGDMRAPVYAYMGIISIMLACAVGAWGRGATIFVVAGALLFYLSDVFVARERFVASTPWNRHLGLPLYYTGQMFLAASIMRMN